MSILERARPDEVGIEPNVILKLFNTLEEKFTIHSMMIMRHNKVVAEGWWAPYSRENTHSLFSLSKSFTSTAIGFAVQEGLLSIDDPVLSFFDDVLSCEPCANMRKMKVKHLLSMTTGHSAEPMVIGDFGERGWVYGFLSSYVDFEPGTKFVYNTPATYMCSAIIQKLTGLTTFEYLTPRLFEPLGIQNIWWETCPQGISTGGFGLNLKTEDIAKFSLFCLNRGMWDGKQLLNPEWIDLATSVHITTDEDGEDWKQGYGYQFWRCVPHASYRGDGAFGQYSIVLPEQDTTIAITSGEDNMRGILTMIWEQLLPAIHDHVEKDDTAQCALEEKCASLILSIPQGEEKNPLISDQKTYQIAPNPLEISEVSFDFSKEVTMTLVHRGQTIKMSVGYGKWVSSETGIPEYGVPRGGHIIYSDVSCAGAWKGNTLTIVTAYIKTPFVDTYDIIFDDRGIVVNYKRNAAFGETNFILFGR